MEDLKIASCTEDCLSIISEESIRIKGSDTREYNISTSKYKIGKSRTITNKGCSSQNTNTHTTSCGITKCKNTVKILCFSSQISIAVNRSIRFKELCRKTIWSLNLTCSQNTRYSNGLSANCSRTNTNSINTT